MGNFAAMTFADRARNITTRGTSLRTKPAVRVPGSPPAYAPAPQHPNDDAKIPDAALAPKIPDTPPDDDPELKFTNVRDVLYYAERHQISCKVVWSKGGGCQGIPRHECGDFWSMCQSHPVSASWRGFFYAQNVTALFMWEQMATETDISPS